VVLGLLTTKNGILEERSTVEARIKEASGYLPIENLALSTQCGFASSGPGNPLSFDEQRAKLELISSVARDVWS
jgi:methionine synthase II (cobalamin-independent)